MARTPSTMLALGSAAPDFRLPDSSGERVALEDFGAAPGLLVVFMCNHCPFVIHIRDGLVALGQDLANQGVAMVAINANDVTGYPGDAPERMAEDVARYGYTFPYLYDESQEVAKAYRAACTPDFFLFDQARRLVYRGQLDDSRPGNDVPVTGRDVRTAVDALVAGTPISADQRPSIGCNIKWKPGGAPDYFG